MTRPIALSLLLLATMFKQSQAQDAQKLQTPSQEIAPNTTLSKTLLDFAVQSKLNVIADTTRQTPTLVANDVTPWPSIKTTGQILGKQSLLFGFHWNQIDTETVLVWPKADIIDIARKIVGIWQQQQWKDNEPPIDINEYLFSVARKVDQDGGEEKRNESIKYNVRLSELPEQDQRILVPLARQAQREIALRFSQAWLSDDFWAQANVRVSKFNSKDTWMIGGSINGIGSSSHGLVPPLPYITYIPTTEKALASAEENEQLGSRWQGTVPDALLRPIQINVENIPAPQAIARISELCNVSIQLDRQAADKVKDKRVTIAANGLTTSLILRNIALLFDLKWMAVDGARVIASLNENDTQNAIAKIGSLPSLESWQSLYRATHPDFDSLFLQEITLAKALGKEGVKFSSLSPDLQATVRNYNEDLEANNILKSWHMTSAPLPNNVKIIWQLSPISRTRNDRPLPTQPLTAEEAKNAESVAHYYAKYYDTNRAFAVIVGNDDFDARYQMRPGLSISTPQQNRGENAP